MSKVRLTGVSKAYETGAGSLQVLSGVSLQIGAGETLAITGPSGTGKSTLLNLVGSLDRPDAGTIHVGDTEVHSLEGEALATYRSSAVSFIFQDHNLLPQLTALENVLLPTLATRKDSGDLAQKAEALLERVGLAERMTHYPARLSGGERQRVAIARALITGSSVLLCDEPTGNLDQETGSAIAALFRDLAASEAVTVIMVTHNLELADGFGRRLEMRDGQLHET